MKSKTLAIVITCCAFALSLGLVACGGSSSGSAAASGSATSAGSASASASASASGASSDATANGYLDDHGLITVKALIELDGAKLTDLADSAGYKWDEKHASWTKVGSDVSPSKALTQEDYNNSTDLSAFNFTADEIAGFATGAKGTPVKWYHSSKAKYNDVADVLAYQQVKVVDQCDVEHRNYGKQTWAIVENSAGDRFLLCAMYYDNKGVVEVFTPEYIATESRGIASEFNLGDYLLEDKHTIDDVWAVLKSGEVS